LLQTVGTGGPNNPVWEALAFAVRQRRPDVLVQWCSQETLEQTVPKFDYSLARADRPGEIRRSACIDPDDVDGLAREYLRQIDALRAEFPHAELELDFTSGTKPMSAAAVFAATARRLPRLHYAVGLRDESGRAVRTDRILSLETGQMMADPLLAELGRLFNQGQFAAVRAQAGGLAADLTDATLLARAQSLAYLAEAYDLWDRFDWKGATRVLHDCPKREKATGQLGRAGWNVDKLTEQRSHLKRCKDGNVCPQRLADLLSNSERRIDQGRYDDATARLYRLSEYVVQVRFQKCFAGSNPQNPTKNVPIEKLAEHAPRLADELRRQGQVAEETVTLALGRTLAALAESGDAVGQYMKGRYESTDPAHPAAKGPLGTLLDARNQSLLAHGSVPVDERACRDLYAEAKAALETHFAAEGLDLADLIAPARFLPCPWV
jgi:CRISPR-associated protein (TIGR02710 family)